MNEDHLQADNDTNSIPMDQGEDEEEEQDEVVIEETAEIGPEEMARWDRIEQQLISDVLREDYENMMREKQLAVGEGGGDDDLVLPDAPFEGVPPEEDEFNDEEMAQLTAPTINASGEGWLQDTGGVYPIDEHRGIYADAEGNVFSRKAKDAEDQAQLDKYWEEYQSMEKDSQVVKDTRVMQQSMDDWDGEEDENKEFTAPRAKGKGKGKRGTEVVQHKCHYIGCLKVLSVKPLYCPGYVEDDIDLEYPFCSYECMAAFALFEIGDPLADSMFTRIQKAAGRVVEPAQIPVEQLTFHFGGLATTSEEVKAKDTHLMTPAEIIEYSLENVD